MLSPPITLYFKGLNTHPSPFSGILTLVAYVVILAAGIYFALDFIFKRNPSAYYINRYIEDVGKYSMNSSSMFNYIQLVDGRNKNAIPIDFNKIEIIGINISLDGFLNNGGEFSYFHWVYSKCNNDSDTKGIGYLINSDIFNESVCIKKFYNKFTRQYYETNDTNFEWPIINHGASHPNLEFYGVIVKKCENTSFRLRYFEECSPEEEIKEYIQNIHINFRIIDYYADVLNFKNPLTKYFYPITAMITEGTFTLNNINFDPAFITTYTGIFFEEKK